MVEDSSLSGLRSESDSALTILVGVARRTCAIPIREVSEVMRPLPIEAIASAPVFVRGVSIIRGVPTPVVSLSTFMGLTSTNEAETRFVTVRAGERRIALAVHRFIGMRALTSVELSGVSPLLSEAPSDYVRALGAADGKLLSVLDCSRLLRDAEWDSLAPGAQA
ncbi:MAG TPA: chemotaxis protein CheW [Polyangiaceae bacterium]|jgi:purine-binding chemotaxis protein CheW|nr:chemotaxis protein CheW [Polyangiaceae bacterium]